MRPFRFIALALAIALSLVAIACSSSDPSPTSSTPGGKITVFAASSLTEVFNELGREFEAMYPGTDVTFNFAGTPTLRTQLEQGARAGVFASANEAQMQMAVDAGVIDGQPKTFATNKLMVITPVGSTKVRSLADLANDGVLFILALPGVPVGAYAREALANLSGANGLPADFAEKTLANLVSEETNVRQVIAKVTLGEADAGIVYESDVILDVMRDTDAIEIPGEQNVIATYPMAQVEGAGNPVTAAAFIEFVLSSEGQLILSEHRFGPVPQ